MNDQDIEHRLRDKYTTRAVDGAPVQLARRVLAIPATSPHRRGWLPRLMNGGLGQMFSATKMVAAIAIIALSGSLLFAGLALDGDPEAPPAATTTTVSLAPGPVAGTVTGVESGTGVSSPPEGETTSLGAGMFKIDGEVGNLSWESSDPRLSGTGTVIENGFQHRQTFTGLYAGAWSITNDAGSWLGTGNHFSRPDGGRDFIIFEGHGGYEGLTAYVAIGKELDSEGEISSRGFEGVVFPGELPTPPQPLTPE